jgi:hypothetical protein
MSAVGSMQGPLYNQVRWKSSHNSYAKEAGIMKQLDEFRFRSIEFDLHYKDDFFGIEKAGAGEWFVFHEFTDRKTNCDTLSECFAEVSEFHRKNPRHHVITVFFDLKDGLHEKSGHGASDFYRALKESLPEGSIVSPADLLEACPEADNLQGAVTLPGCGWPSLSAVRGKFMLVMSTGRDDFVRAGYSPHEAPIFLVSKGVGLGGVHENPDRVFFNMRGPHSFGKEVYKAGFVARAYGLDKREDFLKAKSMCFHHLAMDHIGPAETPWAETDGENGLPYEVIE